jgi:hypothetical protein
LDLGTERDHPSSAECGQDRHQERRFREALAAIADAPRADREQQRKQRRERVHREDAVARQPRRIADLDRFAAALAAGVAALRAE